VDRCPGRPRPGRSATSATCSTGSPAAATAATRIGCATTPAHDRYSLPFFIDPGWDRHRATDPFDDGGVVPLDQQARWDKANLREISGTYGAWLSAKVAKVFPDLATDTGLPVR
jgi:hypothetical protein